MSCSGEGLPKQTAGRFMFCHETVDAARQDVTSPVLIGFAVVKGSDQVSRSRREQRPRRPDVLEPTAPHPHDSP